MKNKTWENFAGLGSIWFFVFIAWGQVEVNPIPQRDASVAKVFAYFQANSDSIKLYTVLVAIGSLGIIAWFGSLWAAIGRTEEAGGGLAIIALLGLVMMLATSSVDISLTAAAAAEVETLTGDVNIMFEIASVLQRLARVGELMLLAAVVMLIWKTGFLPRWMMYLGAAAMIPAAVTIFGVGGDSSIFVWSISVFFVLYAPWAALVGWHLFRTDHTVSDEHSVDAPSPE